MSAGISKDISRLIKKVKCPAPRRLYVRTFKLDTVEKKSESGMLILPQTAYEREIETGVRAKILKLGRGCDPELKEGEWVLIPRFAGTRIDVNGDYVLIHEDTIICMLDAEEAAAEVAKGTES